MKPVCLLSRALAGFQPGLVKHVPAWPSLAQDSIQASAQRLLLSCCANDPFFILVFFFLDLNLIPPLDLPHSHKCEPKGSILTGFLALLLPVFTPTKGEKKRYFTLCGNGLEDDARLLSHRHHDTVLLQFVKMMTRMANNSPGNETSIPLSPCLNGANKSHRSLLSITRMDLSTVILCGPQSQATNRAGMRHTSTQCRLVNAKCYMLLLALFLRSR